MGRIAGIDKDVQEGEPSPLLVGNGIAGKECGRPSSIKHTVSEWASSSPARSVPKGLKAGAPTGICFLCLLQHYTQ